MMLNFERILVTGDITFLLDVIPLVSNVFFIIGVYTVSTNKDVLSNSNSVVLKGKPVLISQWIFIYPLTLGLLGHLSLVSMNV